MWMYINDYELPCSIIAIKWTVWQHTNYLWIHLFICSVCLICINFISKFWCCHIKKHDKWSFRPVTSFQNPAGSVSAQPLHDCYSYRISTYIYNSLSHHCNTLLRATWSIIHFSLPLWIVYLHFWASGLHELILFRIFLSSVCPLSFSISWDSQHSVRFCRKIQRLTPDNFWRATN